MTSLLVDFNYYGYCGSISFEALKSYMVEIGEINGEEIDSSFVLIIFLKVIIFLAHRIQGPIPKLWIWILTNILTHGTGEQNIK